MLRLHMYVVQDASSVVWHAGKQCGQDFLSSRAFGLISCQLKYMKTEVRTCNTMQKDCCLQNV